MTGEVEPTDDQCDWPEDEDDELAEEANEKLQLEDGGDDKAGTTPTYSDRFAYLLVLYYS